MKLEAQVKWFDFGVSFHWLSHWKREKGKGKRETLRWEQGNQINECKKCANSRASVSRALKQRCEPGRWTETFAIILLYKNEMGAKNHRSAWRLCRQRHMALHSTELLGGIKYQGAAHVVHGSNFTAKRKEQIYQNSGSMTDVELKEGDTKWEWQEYLHLSRVVKAASCLEFTVLSVELWR